MADYPIFPFGIGGEPCAADPEAQGIKGANLITMSALGVPVPPGFVVGTEAGRILASDDAIMGAGMGQAVRDHIDDLSKALGRSFDDPQNPLLVSVRSGAAVSMPGMMDTVLNLGLTRDAVPHLAKSTGDERFAWDTYRRFIQSYSLVVLGLENEDFELVLEQMRAREDVASDSELSAAAMRNVAKIYSEIVEEMTATPFLQDPYEQLFGALMAVFRSWNTPRAKRYRDMQSFSHDGGTAATVQSMVFGNRDQNSCTGVYFTRNPSTGEAAAYGEFMLNAQGEEVVSGIRTPQELTKEARRRSLSEKPSMEEELPEAFAELIELGGKLEAHFKDVQEIEFTVESSKLYLLQTRSAKRTPKAALKSAVAMAKEGILSRSEAVSRCDEAILTPMLVSKLAPPKDAKRFAKGLPASPGAVSGEIVFTSDDAVAARDAGRAVILVRPETDPKDVHGMDAAIGILTSRGGMTSHAAVVARGMNKTCITAAMGLKIDAVAGTCSCLGTVLKAGDTISLDGTSGEVYAGEIPIVTPEPDGELAELLSWRGEG
ncbi:pyruvate, phosphate dikinase [Pseudahrensia aquimaris]|uniref:Pyruvate, phosphate dikinase n=1 Tax=Pseudahrensia aquimaris TaxID=744461 RepID=A0ABW3FDR0_9HYPH